MYLLRHKVAVLYGKSRKKISNTLLNRLYEQKYHYLYYHFCARSRGVSFKKNQKMLPALVYCVVECMYEHLPNHQVV